MNGSGAPVAHSTRSQGGSAVFRRLDQSELLHSLFDEVSLRAIFGSWFVRTTGANPVDRARSYGTYVLMRSHTARETAVGIEIDKESAMRADAVHEVVADGVHARLFCGHAAAANAVSRTAPDTTTPNTPMASIPRTTGARS